MVKNSDPALKCEPQNMDRAAETGQWEFSAEHLVLSVSL